MNGHLFITLAVVLSCYEASASFSANSLDDTFDVCPKGQEFVGRPLRTVTGRSHVDCSALCLRENDCQGVNVCPVESGLVSCEMIQDDNSGQCGNLIAAVNPECFYLQPVQEVLSIVCQNGGTPSGIQCQCPREYGGVNCERLVRDCGEIYDNGYQSVAGDGLYTIHPEGSAVPFMVFCEMDYEGRTIIFQRSTTSTQNFNQNWDTLKGGISNDPIPNDSAEFFIGMENLYHLVQQGDYQLNIYMEPTSGGWATVFYNNFVLGDEVSKYAFTYGSFHADPSHPADNYIPSSATFRTSDTDFLCTFSTGGAGWYNACTGDGQMFTASMAWTFSGSGDSLNFLQLKLIRTAPLANNTNNDDE